MRRLLAVLALGAVVVACSEQATSPQPRTPAVAANFTNNPDGGGPNLLWRGFEGNNWNIVWTDGHYIIAFFASPLLRCGHQFPLQKIVSQYKGDIPEFFHRLTMGTLNALVVDVTKPVDCTVPLGSGQFVGWSEDARFTGSDNEVWTEQFPVVHDYANAWRSVYTAKLTAPDGGHAHVTGAIHCVWNASMALDAPYRCHYTINVTK